MKVLSIDLETFSSVDLKTCGVYRYVESPDFEILLFAYSVNYGPVQIVDLKAGEKIPTEIEDMLTSMWVLKTAHNANFERTCLTMHYRQRMPAAQWQCTQVLSLMLGLPASLDQVGAALRLAIQKDKAGSDLIRFFSIPCKPTKANGMRTRNLPVHSPEKWEAYKRYCIRDVETEQEIKKTIAFFTPTDFERKLWHLDQRINDKGVRLDAGFIKNTLRINLGYRNRLMLEAIKITQLDNPNSRDQLINWLNEEMDTDITDLKKDSIPGILKEATAANAGGNAVRMLQIRQQLSKTSIKKYDKMLHMICKDGYARGLLQYYGANRTGRWAGRGVQVQNLTKNDLKDLHLARELVVNNQGDVLEMFYSNPIDVLSQLIRTSFIPSPGCRFLVSDFAAIEARVIAWLANERWRLDVFAKGEDIYKASYSNMFNVPLEQVTKDMRQRGKVAELALGFQGGPGALRRMDSKKLLKDEELQPLVNAWRAASPNIKNYWYTIGNAAIKVIKHGDPIKVGLITFAKYGNSLTVQLPSGRSLVYYRAQLEEGAYGDIIVYEGMDQETKRWGKVDTYGGKLVENIVQGIARDCLAYAMMALDKEGYNIAMHVHDEVVLDLKEGFGTIPHVNEIMARPIPWAPGLELRAESFETYFYKKDDS